MRLSASFRICALVLALGSLGVMTARADEVTGTDPTVSPSARQQAFALQIAQADLARQGVTEPSTEQLALATANVQSLRDQGMGWGEIANSLGLRLGAVVSAENRSPMAQSKVAVAGPQGGKPSPTGSPSVGAKGGQGAGVGGSPGGGRGGNSGGNGGGNGGGGKGGGGGRR